MYLKQRSRGDLVEVLNLPDLFDPFKDGVEGRFHFGEEVQDAELFSKSDLCFLSGEDLPRCWVDSHYRERAA